MEKIQLKSIIESLLFAYGDPISISDLKKATCQNKNEIIIALNELKEDYEKRNSGIRLIKVEDSYQLSTCSDNEEYIVKLLDRSKKKSLSAASLETLTIIAYLQPVTRVEVEEIRGVKCDRVIKNLLDYNLIYEAGKLDKIGRPIIYRTTDQFLKLMDLESVDDLPEIEFSLAKEDE